MHVHVHKKPPAWKSTRCHLLRIHVWFQDRFTILLCCRILMLSPVGWDWFFWCMKISAANSRGALANTADSDGSSVMCARKRNGVWSASFRCSVLMFEFLSCVSTLIVPFLFGSSHKATIEADMFVLGLGWTWDMFLPCSKDVTHSESEYDEISWLRTSSIGLKSFLILSHCSVIGNLFTVVSTHGLQVCAAFGLSLVHGNLGRERDMGDSQQSVSQTRENCLGMHRQDFADRSMSSHGRSWCDELFGCWLQAWHVRFSPRRVKQLHVPEAECQETPN